MFSFVFEGFGGDPLVILQWDPLPSTRVVLWHSHSVDAARCTKAENAGNLSSKRNQDTALAGCRIRWFDGLPGGPEKGQEEGQEAQGPLK